MRHRGYFLLASIFLFQFALLADSPDDNSNSKNIIKYDFTKPVNSNFPVSGESIVSHAGNKFTRGITNLLTGVGEIPRQMIISYRNDGPVLFVPVGLFTGIFMTVVRTGYGAVETVTFFAPLEGTYNSLLEPAYVWGPMEYKVDIAVKNNQ